MPVVKELVDDKSVKQFLDLQAAQPSPTSVLGLFASANDKGGYHRSILVNQKEGRFCYRSISCFDEQIKPNLI